MLKGGNIFLTLFLYNKSRFKMSNIIDKIRISGTTYDLPVGISSGEVETMISAATSGYTSRFDEDEEVTAAALNDLNENKQDKLSAGTGISISGNVISATGGSGGNPTVELTQAEYDALVSGGTVSADTYYIITDATPIDLSPYWTSAQTQSAITSAVSTKQDTLVEGRAIDITNNTVSLDLPISAGTGTNSIREGHSGNTASGNNSHAEGAGTTASGWRSHAEGYRTSATSESSHAEGSNTTASEYYTHAEGYYTIASGINSHAEGEGTSATSLDSHAEGAYTRTSGSCSHAEGGNTIASGQYSHAEGYYSEANGGASHADGAYTIASGYASHAEGRYTSALTDYSHTEGVNTFVTNNYEHASGLNNLSTSATATFGDSGNTLFSVGNGTSTSARHNAFEIRQNGDIYLTSGGTDIKLQDHLGGGSITVDTALDSGSTNPVENRVIYNKIDEVEEVTAAALNNINDRLSEDEEVTAAGLNAVNDKFGGLQLVKISQSDYDNLQVKDSNTLYIVI